MERCSQSFARAIELLCSGVELRLCAEAYGGSALIDYAGLAADDFDEAYAVMEDALTLT